MLAGVGRFSREGLEGPRWPGVLPDVLGTVLAAYGFRLSPERLERATGAEGRKATLAGLETAARNHRCRAKTVQLTPDQFAGNNLLGMRDPFGLESGGWLDDLGDWYMGRTEPHCAQEANSPRMAS